MQKLFNFSEGREKLILLEKMQELRDILEKMPKRPKLTETTPWQTSFLKLYNHLFETGTKLKEFFDKNPIKKMNTDLKKFEIPVTIPEENIKWYMEFAHAPVDSFSQVPEKMQKNAAVYNYAGDGYIDYKKIADIAKEPHSAASLQAILNKNERATTDICIAILCQDTMIEQEIEIKKIQDNLKETLAKQEKPKTNIFDMFSKSKYFEQKL